MSKWVKYIRPASVKDRAEEPEIAVWRSKKLSFTKAAVDLYHIRDYKFIKLFYRNEGKEQMVGIELTNDRTNEREIFAITKAKTNTVVSASMFFDDNDIKVTATRRYELRKEDDLLVFGPIV